MIGSVGAVGRHYLNQRSSFDLTRIPAAPVHILARRWHGGRKT
jgi:hypothetical protein